MKKEIFLSHFRKATEAACAFAKRFVYEDLPAKRKYRVRLNQSYDGGPLHEDEVVFPEDSTWEKALLSSSCGEEEALGFLWREGRVPEWIDLSVLSVQKEWTLLLALVCGRFTNNERLLYHTEEGRPPFHVVGPSFPFKHQEGELFSIFHRSEGWTLEELESLVSEREKVWSLELHGPLFTDSVLSGLPPFPSLEVLELRRSPLLATGALHFGAFPDLRVFRLALEEREEVSFETFPFLPWLEDLALDSLPQRVRDLESLSSKAPRLLDLQIATTHPWSLSQMPRFPELTSFRLCVGGRVEALELSLYPRLKDLSLEGRGFSDALLSFVLDSLPDLERLHVRGTGAGEKLVGSIQRHENLRFADLSDTEVAEEHLQEIKGAKGEGFRLRPWKAGRTKDSGRAEP